MNLIINLSPWFMRTSFFQKLQHSDQGDIKKITNLYKRIFELRDSYQKEPNDTTLAEMDRVVEDYEATFDRLKQAFLDGIENGVNNLVQSMAVGVKMITKLPLAGG